MRRGASAMVGLTMGFIAGCSMTPAPPPSGSAALRPAPDASVTIIDRGWHTDIALPADSLSGTLAEVAKGFAGARYLVFGFGDREFYMSRKESVLQTVKAMLPGPGVILVTALKRSPADAFGAEHVITLRLSCGERAALDAFVAGALATRAGDRPHPLAGGPYPGSQFYASDEIYGLFHNCNRWTAEALREAGLPVDSEGVILAGQIMGQVEALARHEAQHHVLAAGGCAPTAHAANF